MIAFAGFGLIVSLFMEHLPLHTSVDRDWGLQDLENKQDGSPSSEEQDVI